MNDLDKAVKVIKEGGIVVYPTDTAFGIGCRMDNEKSVRRLFELRKRPFGMATPVLFDSIDRVKEYVIPFNKEVKDLMVKYWPGALTIILLCSESKIPALVRGDGKTLGVRIPDNEIALSLIKGAKIPILGSSANFHGEETPYSIEALDKRLIKLVDFVLEGKTKGKSLPSTVVDCTQTPFKIIRQGVVVLDL